MIQLHYYPSTASMAPHILLRELKVPFELLLYVAAAICLHLCDMHPAARLIPKVGTPERAHFYKWLMWLTNTLQATWITYFYPERWVNVGNACWRDQLWSRRLRLRS